MKLKNKDEKKGEKERLDSSFQDFRNFIADMNMGDIKVRGDIYTWANNRAREGFIQERLDKFCGLAEWMLANDTTEVTHVLRQASDYSVIILDTEPTRERSRARFICEARWFNDPESESVVKEAWQRPVEGQECSR